MKFQVNEKGFYGDFGGAYIPEAMYPNIEELRRRYLDIMGSNSFQKEFQSLLKDYVGRPSPLYFSKRFSEEYGSSRALLALNPQSNTVNTIAWNSGRYSLSKGQLMNTLSS